MEFVHGNPSRGEVTAELMGMLFGVCRNVQWMECGEEEEEEESKLYWMYSKEGRKWKKMLKMNTNMYNTQF